MSIKNILKEIYRGLIKIPLIGYCIQILMGIIKLPRFKKFAIISIYTLNQKSDDLHCRLDGIEVRLAKIEQTLPALLNMMQSSHASLRTFKQEMHQVKHDAPAHSLSSEIWQNIDNINKSLKQLIEVGKV